MPMTSRCYWLMLLATVAAALLAGCGGGGRAPQGRTAAATITVKWPARGRLIPVAANSVKVVAYNLSGFSAPRVLNRPTEGGLSTATFDRLPAGMLYFAADAYPQTDAGGVAQATATASTNAVAGSHLDITMTLASTITQVVVAPNNATVDIDGALPITATPKNAADEVVLVAPGNITFSSASPSVVIVDPSTGVATGVRSASTTITATESESGLSGSVNVTGAFPPGTFAGEERTNPADGATMVWVPAGNFLMGGADGNFATKPLHTVALDGYWIYKYEVTYEQYQAFCTAASRVMPAAPSWGWLANHPIVNVTWNDATAYADWMGVKLPTEAQWEKAARGADGRRFPWGDTWDSEKCNNIDDTSTIETRMETSQVGSYPAGASPYGAMDMLGNVYEFCSDWYQANYYLSPSSNPTGPTTGTSKVMRSTAYYDNPTFLQYFYCYSRRDVTTDNYGDSLGFRCAVAARDAVLDNSSVTDGTITIQ